MNNSTNYVKQIKNAKRGGYTPTLAKDVNKHKIQKAIRLIEQWRTLPMNSNLKCNSTWLLRWKNVPKTSIKF